jgi:hypothetical protein
MIFGPGNFPLTVGMLLVVQSLVTFSNPTYKISERKERLELGLELGPRLKIGEFIHS